jgi:hypothetical protein
MRVLVAAIRVDGGTTSEGACTAKAVGVLAALGHRVQLLVPADQQAPAVAVVPGGVEIVGVPPASGAAARLGRRWAVGGRRWRPDVPVQLLTGFPLEERAAVAGWRRALRRAEASWRPDVTWTRGAGDDQTTLLARAALGPGRWAANLHDPWPRSWFGVSYAARARGISRRQEATARRLLRQAPLVTAPSARLLAWMEGHSGVALGCRGEVVPHLGGPVVPSGEPPPPTSALTLVHTGTLLGPRHPGALLDALDRLHLEEPATRAQVRLTLVGPLDRRHRDDGDLWARLRGRADVQLVDRRVSHAEAEEVLRSGTVAVVIEADDEESPFFPAKLADGLASGRPVLALSPRRSVASDLLGEDDALRVDPGDVAAITGALRTVWRAWQDGTLGDLVPDAAVRDQVGLAAVGDALDRALRRAAAG